MNVPTTPKHTFTFPVEPDEFKRILITYAQGDQIILEKTEQDLTFEEVPIKGGKVAYTGWLRLSQAETLLFDTSKKTFTVQVRAITHYGEAIAGEKHVFGLDLALNDGVIQ